MGEVNELHHEDEAIEALLTRIAAERDRAASAAADEVAGFLADFDAHVTATIRPTLEAVVFEIEQQPGMAGWVADAAEEGTPRAEDVPVQLFVAVALVDPDPDEPLSPDDADGSLHFHPLPEVAFVRVERRVAGGELQAMGAFTLSHLDEHFVTEIVKDLLAHLAGETH